MEFSRGLNMVDTDRFVKMYVNEYTMDMGVDGERAIRVLLEMGHEDGLLPEPQLLFV